MNLFKINKPLIDTINQQKDKLHCPHINKGALLYAIAGCESKFGYENRPRFEPTYYKGGKWYIASPEVRKLVNKYDRDGASSWGKWQIMYPTACELGYNGNPELLGDDNVNLAYAIAYINIRVFNRKPSATISDVLDAYNSGSCLDKYKPEKYIAEGLQYYSDTINSNLFPAQEV